ncbi:MAG TPA: amidohydrolase family protein [Pseudonocardia sp.]|uniref:metal-dependent hydrolase family protein n=1 Tax=Pseudonocardia sp. TaxID=60912 RepID=UPI002C363530|nr:amidohydrolase family protein [Pseudonocardia sp.]HTF48061.1 amidohydrolase family protein [Pseudonocardia sp.]
MIYQWLASLEVPMPSPVTVLKNGVALVGPELTERPFRTLALRGDSIGEFDVQAGETVVDLGGAYVIPGLVDCHVHFDLAAHPLAYVHWDRSGFVRSITCLHNGLLALRAGITAVRDLGSVDHLVLEYAAHVRAGTVTGPRVAAAGRPITITGGHCAQYGLVADGPVAVRTAVRAQIAGGAPVVKLMATGGISTPGNPGVPGLNLDEMTAAVEEAHKLGARVAAHAHSPAGIVAALTAGVDTIEHAAFADDDALELIKSTGATLVPTVSALNNIAPGVGIPDDTVEKSLAARETYRASTARAIGAGVRIAAGTDAGTAFNPIGGLVDELEMYCAAGMSAFEAVRAATVRAGAVVGGQVGMIAAGYRADLLVLADDPRTDIAALRKPSRVIARGKVLNRAWLDDTLEEYAGVLA